MNEKAENSHIRRKVDLVPWGPRQKYNYGSYTRELDKRPNNCNSLVEVSRLGTA